MGIPRKEASVSRSRSPVTMRSAWPATAHSRTRSSSLSRQIEIISSGMTRTDCNRAASVCDSMIVLPMSRGWAEFEDVFGFEVAGLEEVVDEGADGSVASGVGGEEAVRVGGDVGEDVWVGVGGAGGEAGKFHGPEVVDIVSEEAGLLEGDSGLLGPFAKGCCFVAAAFDDVGNDELGGEAVN